MTEKRVQLEDLKLRLTSGTNKGVVFPDTLKTSWGHEEGRARARACVCVCVCCAVRACVPVRACVRASVLLFLSFHFVSFLFLFVSLKVTRTCGISPMSAVC